MDPVSLRCLRERWNRAVDSFAVSPELADVAFANLTARYAEPGRHYHTLEHISAVLHAIEDHGDTAPALLFAAWYHDVVYDTLAADNEERSAEFGRSALAAMAVPEDVVRETVRLILLTKTHQTSQDDAPGQIMLDADLAVLGADREAYDRYAAAIRREYAWVPDVDYRAERCRVLEAFLARPRIYRLLSRAEEAARRNLRREIDVLKRT
jgi:predicted metal-dependent HD superfamily phosphohydrolase